jgi:hypothetical protein
MNEAEWLACADPVPLLLFLPRTISDRKLRLFCCACCRAIWQQMKDRRSRAAVEAAERYADGLITADDLTAARDAAGDAAKAAKTANTRAAKSAAGASAMEAVFAVARQAGMTAAGAYAAAATRDTRDARGAAWAVAKHAGRGAVWAAQAHLVRDIVGKPFRPVPACSVSAEGRSLAQAAYEDRQQDGALSPIRLSILAGWLEETGGLEQAILDHLRGPGPHARGCWAVDWGTGRSLG